MEDCQRVGVGLMLAKTALRIVQTRSPVNCQNPVTSGVTLDGGYAEVMIAEARWDRVDS